MSYWPGADVSSPLITAVWRPVRVTVFAVYVTDVLTLLRELLGRIVEDCWLLTVRVAFFADCEIFASFTTSFLADEATIFDEDFWTDDRTCLLLLCCTCLLPVVVVLVMMVVVVVVTFLPPVMLTDVWRFVAVLDFV